MQGVLDRASAIRLFGMDVDGVLSDGSLFFSNSGEEIKAFSVLDGLGIKMLADSGVVPAIITGRQSDIVARRAASLGIEHVVQGRDDKWTVLDELRQSLGLTTAQVAYMGDDLPDLKAIINAGLGITVPNGHSLVQSRADWQTSASGGSGAVREACEMIMRAQNTLQLQWEKFLP